jgi:hypothetical protein
MSKQETGGKMDASIEELIAIVKFAERGLESLHCRYLNEPTLSSALGSLRTCKEFLLYYAEIQNERSKWVIKEID